MRRKMLWLAAVCLLLESCAGGPGSGVLNTTEPGSGEIREENDPAGQTQKQKDERREEQNRLSGESSESGSAEDAAGLLEEMELLQWTDPENENLADMLQRQGGGCMVQIGAGSSLGSGVIYGEEQGDLLILTAAHVLEEAEDGLWVTFSDGLSLACGDFVCYDLADLGLLRVPGTELPQENLEQYKKVISDQESFDAVRPGDGCIVMGSRTGVAAEAYEGTVLDGWVFLEDYGQYMMWVKAEVQPGMSGGGLFDSRGHFLGILSGGSADGELAAVPLCLIRAALEEE